MRTKVCDGQSGQVSGIDSKGIMFFVIKTDVTKIADGCKYEGISCATGLIK